MGNGNSNLSNMSSFNSIPRSKSQLYNITSVDVNCEFSDNYAISWHVYESGLNTSHRDMLEKWNNRQPVALNSGFTFDRMQHSMLMPCCHVNYGAAFVNVKVSMLDGWNITAGFVTDVVFVTFITQTNLVVDIGVGNHEMYSYNSTVGYDINQIDILKVPRCFNL